MTGHSFAEHGGAAAQYEPLGADSRGGAERGQTRCGQARKLGTGNARSDGGSSGAGAGDEHDGESDGLGNLKAGDDLSRQSSGCP